MMKNKMTNYNKSWKEINAKEKPRIVDAAGFWVVFVLLIIEVFVLSLILQ